MKRHVIRQGNDTLTITLPRKWAKQLGIKAGDEIDLEEKEDSLVISSERRPEWESKEVDLSEFDLLIPRTIHALYKRGYDELNLLFSSPHFLSLIQKAMGNETIGYEITQQGNKSCVVKSISEILKTEFDPTLRRIFLTLNFMAQDGLEAIKNKNEDKLKGLLALEETNNRLATFCRRALNKYGYPESKKLTFVYCIIEALEKIADEYKYLFNFVLNEKNLTFSKETEEIYKKTNSQLYDFYQLFYNFEPKKAVKIAKERKEVINQAYALFKKKNSREIRALHHLIILNQEIFNLLGPLIALRV